MKPKFTIELIMYDDESVLSGPIMARHLIKGDSLVEIASKVPLIIAETARELGELERVELMEKEDIPF